VGMVTDMLMRYIAVEGKFMEPTSVYRLLGGGDAESNGGEHRFEQADNASSFAAGCTCIQAMRTMHCAFDRVEHQVDVLPDRCIRHFTFIVRAENQCRR